MKNTITEMKNTWEEINSRIDDTEKWISKLEDRVLESTEAQQKKEWKWGQFKRSLRQHQKYQHYFIGAPEREEEREREAGNIHEEITAEKFPNLEKEIDIQVQEI